MICGRKRELGSLIKKKGGGSAYTSRGMAPQQGKQGFDVNIIVKARVLDVLEVSFLPRSLLARLCSPYPNSCGRKMEFGGPSLLSSDRQMCVKV